jgi:hypothetical protein
LIESCGSGFPAAIIEAESLSHMIENFANLSDGEVLLDPVLGKSLKSNRGDLGIAAAPAHPESLIR